MNYYLFYFIIISQLTCSTSSELESKPSLSEILTFLSAIYAFVNIPNFSRDILILKLSQFGHCFQGKLSNHLCLPEEEVLGENELGEETRKC